MSTSWCRERETQGITEVKRNVCTSNTCWDILAWARLSLNVGHQLEWKFNFLLLHSDPTPLPSSPSPPHPVLIQLHHRWTLDLCLHAPLLIPKINSSAHLCPSNTTLTSTTGGILPEKNVPLWLHGETSGWPFHLSPSLCSFPTLTGFI